MTARGPGTGPRRTRRLDRRRQAAIGIAILAAAVGWSSGAFLPGRTRDLPQLGGPAAIAPDFELTGLDGTTARLHDHHGSPTVLVFFASWCDSCVEEADSVTELARLGRARDVVVLGVAVEDDAGSVARFLGATGMDLRVAVDPTMATARAYGVIGPPATVFIDAGGAIRHRVIGPLTMESATAGLAAIGTPAP